MVLNFFEKLQISSYNLLHILLHFFNIVAENS